MQSQVIVDTGVLIALIDRLDNHHNWVVNQLKQITPPLLTCEAVISETWFLLQRVRNGRETLIQLLTQKFVVVQFDFDLELETVISLLNRYQSVPVSLADAELVSMSELYANSLIFTLDSDFQIYRKNRDRQIPLIIP
ncbi:MAG: type II toxin-antitoxin system VapC family toxin [Pseudanabaena sp.]|jgi:predicted nucleic acid-binding protein|nr:PIN domain-containing protein [Pseudanabaena sp. M090S1SP2A07QC]MCA6506845.1 PIN domain-containing protein [Pseudanabaena sp. M172S2SP2A07QC]MCA6509575.1 PIN domain-containing protein [Pseudanabaena sp. M109S1SP2A07QC]MCA6519887.1 PIN domain-containing protein [Pseudanabaena sp. M110S1SP2A07QC]MCA6524275.1 PIN domain-containing protein [Pseudanabaena sp. M051S1SP2A07QC]MCA6527771.1 PIN domain-containing protein [Pseudanabaena sp. M179S2SP2A07QC]MCA6528613.1 PIN domain-containing protein [P